jgi:sugar-specific transcriptional regulator TrmB
VLVDLGLSLTQAKIYLSLIHLGRAKVGDIYKKSGVARQDIYRVLEKLLEFGLIEKIVCSPVEYVPLPLTEGISMLVNRKKTEFEKIAIKAEKIKEQGFITNSLEHEGISGEIIATMEKDVLNSKTRRTFMNAEQTVEYVCKWNAFIAGSMAVIDESRRAARRGIKGRTVVESPKYSLTIPNPIQKFMREQILELRIIGSVPFFFLGIIDKREIIFTPSPCRNMQAITYWSRDKGFAELANSYFETIWNKATIFNIHNLQKNVV